MTRRKLLMGMYRACLEYAEHIRTQGGAYWPRHWERAMKDAQLTRQLLARV